MNVQLSVQHAPIPHTKWAPNHSSNPATVQHFPLVQLWCQYASSHCSLPHWKNYTARSKTPELPRGSSSPPTIAHWSLPLPQQETPSTCLTSTWQLHCWQSREATQVISNCSHSTGPPVKQQTQGGPSVQNYELTTTTSETSTTNDNQKRDPPWWSRQFIDLQATGASNTRASCQANPTKSSHWQVSTKE